ncbi:hypothetical protein Q3G72_021943 [Acer saccharum]|nr:hypothetical protein Q3G72_021943 [Acer saccharum]
MQKDLSIILTTKFRLYMVEEDENEAKKLLTAYIGFGKRMPILVVTFDMDKSSWRFRVLRLKFVGQCKINFGVFERRFSIYNTWNNIRVESWKMKELRWMYSWKKLFVIEPNLALDEGFVYVKPLLVMRNDEILIEKREGQLILHDPRSEIETYFKIRGDPRLFHETGFVGSLVSPFHNQG